MKFLLDTDHISILQKKSGQEYAVLSARIAQQQPTDLAYCMVSFHEQVLGCHTFLTRAQDSADVVRGYAMLERVLDDFAKVQVLPFDASGATQMDALIAQRIRLATMDMRIAAIALSRGLKVITRNLRDFVKVPGLTTDA